jgi:hypothetical protein
MTRTERLQFLRGQSSRFYIRRCVQRSGYRVSSAFASFFHSVLLLLASFNIPIPEAKY